MLTDFAAVIRASMPWRVALWMALVVAVGLVVANVGDWASFRFALRSAEQVSTAEWAAMFARAREFAHAEGRRLKGRDLAAEFARLRAMEAEFSRNHAQFRLWAQGGLMVYVNFDFGRDWDRVSLHVSSTPHWWSTLWSVDPSVTAQLDPKGRLLTVMVGGYGKPLRDWVVLPSEIRVVERDRLGSYNTRSFPLSQGARVRITTAADAIPAEFRGHHYVSESANGSFLRVNFRADGRHGWSDIKFENIWCDQLDALMDALADVAPDGPAVDFKTRISRNRLDVPAERFVRTWAEIAEGETEYLELPWWCLWARWPSLRTPD